MKRIATVVVAVLIACFGGDLTANAEDKEKQQLVELLEQIDAHVASEDSAAAKKLIESQGDTLEVARLYMTVTNHFYRNRHDVSRMLEFGDAAVKYMLAAADKAESADAELAEKLRSFAKAMCYNISVNAWPGWDDPGITITPSDSRAALEAAKLNLKLGIELKKPAEAMGNAHWLLGAQYLAMRDHDPAIEEFTKAAVEFQLAEKPDFLHMANGYLGIAHIVQNSASAQGRKMLDAAIEKLEARNTEDAKFFIGQLKSVEKNFVKP